MLYTGSPTKFPTAFAEDGQKNAIPEASQIGITDGAASLTDGFPPLTMTPMSLGGIPPSGKDMNGILNEISDVSRWANAGGGYRYDSSFANNSNVGGYPKGAKVLAEDGKGYWISTADNNVTDPDQAGASGWVPDFAHSYIEISASSSTIVLSEQQYNNKSILIYGLLSADIELGFPQIYSDWFVTNATSGNFKIRATSGSGLVDLPQGFMSHVYVRGTDVRLATNNLKSIGGSENIGFNNSESGGLSMTVHDKLVQTLNILDFDGVDPTGSTSSTVGFQAALNAASSIYGQLIIPAGTYRLSGVVNVSGTVSIIGHGNTSIIKGDVGSFITCAQNAVVKFENLYFMNYGHSIIFYKCTYISIKNCSANGFVDAGSITTQGFRFRGCIDIEIRDSNFTDYRDAIYLDKDDTFDTCRKATIRGCLIQQLNSGTNQNYPTGVYAYYVDEVYVSDTIFKNIYPSAGSTGTGYGFYEGDASYSYIVRLIQITGCTFIDDDVFRTTASVGCLISTATQSVVSSCVFRSEKTGFVGFHRGAVIQTISDCLFDQAACTLDRTHTSNYALPLYFAVLNSHFFNINGTVLRVSPNTPGVYLAKISGNTFESCKYGPISLGNVRTVMVDGNLITKCTSNNPPTDSFCGGINSTACYKGLISNNLIINDNDNDLEYGVNSAGLHELVTQGNKYIGVFTANTRNVISLDTETGTFSPTVIGGGQPGSADYINYQNSYYTKNGNVVTCFIKLNWENGTGTGSLNITGLPITAKNDVYGSVTFSWFDGVDLTASNVATAYVAANTDRVIFYQYPAGGGTAGTVAYDPIGNIACTITYMV